MHEGQLISSICSPSLKNKRRPKITKDLYGHCSKLCRSFTKELSGLLQTSEIWIRLIFLDLQAGQTCKTPVILSQNPLFKANPN
jgi:hypothetical protein